MSIFLLYVKNGTGIVIRTQEINIWKTIAVWGEVKWKSWKMEGGTW
jgi:hypothetical protein